MRGSHVSLSHPDAWPIDRALIDVGKVIPDFRAPDNLRFGLAPLYNTHLDVHTAIQRLRTDRRGRRVRRLRRPRNSHLGRKRVQSGWWAILDLNQ